jgi:hypothetical protein
MILSHIFLCYLLSKISEIEEIVIPLPKFLERTKEWCIVKDNGIWARIKAKNAWANWDDEDIKNEKEWRNII